MSGYLSESEVAELLGIRVTTLRNRYSLGYDMPPRLKLSGRKIVFLKEDIDAFVLAKRQVVSFQPQPVPNEPAKRGRGRPRGSATKRGATYG